MATIGLDSIHYATITEDADGNETYGNPTRIVGAMTAALEIELAEATLYADDGAAYSIKDFASGTLTLGVSDLGKSVAAALTGATIDRNGVLVSQTENTGMPVAIGFRSMKPDATYRYFWLYRVKFSVPSADMATKGDSITFSTPTIEGTILRRNKPDGQSKHPWKTEANEGDTDVTSATISSWFTTVYEPVYQTP
jgi:phi13 family phage major tail protein